MKEEEGISTQKFVAYCAVYILIGCITLYVTHRLGVPWQSLIVGIIIGLLVTLEYILYKEYLSQ